jgi:hypothetical protein
MNLASLQTVIRAGTKCGKVSSPTLHNLLAVERGVLGTAHIKINVSRSKKVGVSLSLHFLSLFTPVVAATLHKVIL